MSENTPPFASTLTVEGERRMEFEGFWLTEIVFWVTPDLSRMEVFLSSGVSFCSTEMLILTSPPFPLAGLTLHQAACSPSTTVAVQAFAELNATVLVAAVSSRSNSESDSWANSILDVGFGGNSSS